MLFFLKGASLERKNMASFFSVLPGCSFRGWGWIDAAALDTVSLFVFISLSQTFLLCVIRCLGAV
jgi:hypothetical protein